MTIPWMWSGCMALVGPGVLGHRSVRFRAINAAGANGLFFGDVALLATNCRILATWVYAGVGTWILLKILDSCMGLRVSDEDEQMGLDMSQHNEAGYGM